MLTINKADRENINDMCLLLEELFTLEKDFTPDWERQRRWLELILDNLLMGCLLLLKRGREVLGMANLLVTISMGLGEKVVETFFKNS
jgi:hypothetical protein